MLQSICWFLEIITAADESVGENRITSIRHCAQQLEILKSAAQQTLPKEFLSWALLIPTYSGAKTTKPWTPFYILSMDDGAKQSEVIFLKLFIVTHNILFPFRVFVNEHSSHMHREIHMWWKRNKCTLHQKHFRADSWPSSRLKHSFWKLRLALLYMFIFFGTVTS